MRNITEFKEFISGIASIGLLALSIYLAILVYREGIIVLEAGNWRAPFGIVLVGDLLATLMVLLTSIIATACLFFAFKTISPRT